MSLPFRPTRMKTSAPNSSLSLSAFSAKLVFCRRKFSSLSCSVVFLASSRSEEDSVVFRIGCDEGQ